MTAQPETQTETILLVDSDVIARTTVAEYLRGCGYKVLEATTMQEALTAIQNHPVDILVSDVELPAEGSGFALASWVRTHAKHIRILLIGSIEHAAEKAGELCEEGPTLGKPYHPQLLLDEIKRLRSRG